jgi:hypothetical protein
MTAAEEISVLTNSLSFWEYAAYLSISAVAVGVAGEVVHDFTSWLKGIRWWAEKGSKYSALLLVIALVAELIIQIKENSINGRITAILEHETAIANERTAEIEKITAWRKIEPATAQKLSAALGAIPPTVPHKVVFSYAQNDPEALYFTFQIGRLFLANKKWDANIFAETHPGILYWDVRVLGPDNDTTRAVRRAFETAGIAFSTEAVPGGFQSYGYMPKPEDTVIQVGPKKPPFEP